MFKKILHGFLFGIGFSLAIILIGWLLSSFQFSFSDKTNLSVPHEQGLPYKEKAKWQALPIAEKLTKVSGVAVLRFKEEDDKLMAAYVDSVLSKDSSVMIPLSIGDRVEESDYYAKDSFTRNRDGILVMYVDNPPKEIESAYLYESRLIAYGDMPLEVFLKKFKHNNK